MNDDTKKKLRSFFMLDDPNNELNEEDLKRIEDKQIRQETRKKVDDLDDFA